MNIARKKGTKNSTENGTEKMIMIKENETENGAKNRYKNVHEMVRKWRVETTWENGTACCADKSWRG